jgi:hypothetical protein
VTFPKSFVVAVLLLAGSESLVAQAVVVPHTVKLDSVQTRVRAAVFVLRDSLKYVDAASGRIARDLKTTSNAGLIARARYLSQRCAAAARTVPATAAVVSGAGRPEPDTGGVRSSMERGLKELGSHMDRCREEFATLATVSKQQELRDYGIGRGARVQQSIRSYEAVLRRYYGTVIGERYTPDFTGAGSIPRSQ